MSGLRIAGCWTLVVLMIGCGGDGIGGDWFPCEDGDICRSLDDDGYRLQGGK